MNRLDFQEENCAWERESMEPAPPRTDFNGLYWGEAPSWQQLDTAMRTQTAGWNEEFLPRLYELHNSGQGRAGQGRAGQGRGGEESRGQLWGGEVR